VTLIAVVIGARLTHGFNARTQSRRDEVDARAGARLLLNDLSQCYRKLNLIVEHDRRWDIRNAAPSLPTWASERAILAQVLPPDDWEAVLSAVGDSELCAGVVRLHVQEARETKPGRAHTLLFGDLVDDVKLSLTSIEAAARILEPLAGTRWQQIKPLDDSKISVEHGPESAADPGY
jgi:hypothetical protein